MGIATPLQVGATVMRYTWTLTDADPTGTAIEVADLADKTVQLAGDFGGGTVTIEGSNDGSNWATLTDPQGNALSKVAAAIELIAENPLQVRPKITGSTGANLTVSLVARGHRR